ncbi:MAG: LysR family transcriptional regulator [Pyramidobacter sp.]|nr:LysR family transcriptional regulator [Pyramidobacter sp.]
MRTDIVQAVTVTAEKGSITKAAEALGISQPALTHIIKKLESELGAALFDRSAAPLRLTYAGERYCAAAEKMRALQNAMDAEMRDIARGITGRVRIGMAVEQCAAWLPLFLPEFIRRYPRVELSVREGTSEDFEKWLLEGSADICISSLPVCSSDIQYETFLNSPIYLIASREHALAQGKDLFGNSPARPLYVEPSRLNGEKFIMTTPQQGMGRLAAQILETHGVRPASIMRLTSNRAVARLAASGVGVAFTTYSGCLAALELPGAQPVFCTVEDPMIFRRAVIAYRSNPVFSPAHQYMLRLMRGCLRSFEQLDIAVQHAPAEKGIVS